MVIHHTQIQPGVYQYHYPTFVDTPQLLCVHFITPDAQQAYVSYPKRSFKKAAQLIPVSWFGSVIMEKMVAEPQLMPFLEITLVSWFCQPVSPLVKLEQFRNECVHFIDNDFPSSQVN